jgi:hypothetical protein
MSHVSTRRARIAAAASAAAIAGGVALGLLTGGGSATVADGTVISQVVAPVVPVTSALLDQSGSTGGAGGAHTEGTRIG